MLEAIRESLIEESKDDAEAEVDGATKRLAKQEEDVTVLEDVLDRITLKNSHVFPINELVIGSILALNGKLRLTSCSV